MPAKMLAAPPRGKYVRFSRVVDGHRVWGPWHLLRDAPLGAVVYCRAKTRGYSQRRTLTAVEIDFEKHCESCLVERGRRFKVVS